MAQQKGLSKKHSPLQKEHYKSHPFRLTQNRRARLVRYLKRKDAEIRRKANRKDPRLVKPDMKAVRRARELFGIEWNVERGIW